MEPLTQEETALDTAEATAVAITAGRRKAVLALGLMLAVILALGLVVTVSAQTAPFPELIELPDGFQPEGIARGRGTTAYVAGFATGAIYQIDLKTGQGSMLVPAQEGRMALGVEFDRRTGYLFVAGGFTGQLYVYDTATGENVAEFQLTTEPETVINDLIVTHTAVYITDSFRPVYYRLPLRSGGRLPDADAVEEITLTGDFEFVPGALNGNGIEATPNGSKLIMSHTNLGKLYLRTNSRSDALGSRPSGVHRPDGNSYTRTGVRCRILTEDRKKEKISN